MIYFVEKLFNINIHNPFTAIIQTAERLSDCIMTASAWSEAATVFTEYFFLNIRDWLCSCLLDRSIQRCRDS